MKKTKSKLLLITLGITLLTLLNPIQVSAVLQSNGGTPATKGVDDWILAIRQMEATGGTLGLNETINTTGLLPTEESGSNGLDCHMEKNTEYGAMVLLAASSYGNSDPIVSGGTTTGNVTGVVMKINKEWVAAGAGITNSTYFKAADSRYIHNDYGLTKGGKYHVGDAMEQGTWHGSNKSEWLKKDTVSGLLRSYAGSVFSYNGYYGTATAAQKEAHYDTPWYCRAVIAIGEGL